MSESDKTKPGFEGKNSSLQTTEESLAKKSGSWISGHYLSLINLILALYLFLSLLAPILMKVGRTEAADHIYRLYRLSCHQLAYRSFYLFGEQLVYPRELADVEGLKSYEEMTGNDGEDISAAINFRGNQTLGYKTALCQRDLAIYGSLLLFGIVFAISGKRIKPLPWFLWILLGLMPIGLDGVSQLISQAELNFLPGLAVRESTPLLRVLTGFLFGWFTGWFGFPSIEDLVPAKNTKNLDKREVGWK